VLEQSSSLRFNREAALSSIAETIQNGSYFADLFANQKMEPAVYHYIITRNGSSDILDWGQGFSMESIRQQAENWLADSAQSIAS
jgi:hypothetical protein